MPFSMRDEKGIDIDARLRSSMPSGTPEWSANLNSRSTRPRQFMRLEHCTRFSTQIFFQRFLKKLQHVFYIFEQLDRRHQPLDGQCLHYRGGLPPLAPPPLLLLHPPLLPSPKLDVRSGRVGDVHISLHLYQKLSLD